MPNIRKAAASTTWPRGQFAEYSLPQLGLQGNEQRLEARSKDRKFDLGKELQGLEVAQEQTFREGALGWYGLPDVEIQTEPMF